MNRYFKWAISLTMLISLFSTPVLAMEYTRVDVGYQVKTSEWFEYAWGGALGGTEGGAALTALEINLDSAPFGSGIEYRVYTQSGWLAWTPSFAIAGNGEAILGVQIQLTDFEYANVYYQTYRKGLGWGTWQSNGSTSGQLSSENPITGIRVQVDEIGVEYQSNVGGVDQVLRHNNETQGSGLIYTVKMGLISSAVDDNLEYRAYFKNSGWTNWVNNMTVLGSERGGDYITALEARLVGLDQYHVSIQPQVNGTWWDYAYDGQTAGSASIDSAALTAYRIKVERIKTATSNANSTNTSNEASAPGSLSINSSNEILALGVTPLQTNLLYSADINAMDLDEINGDYDYTEARILSGYSALTVNSQFDDNPAGIDIGVNDQFKASLYSLASNNRIQIPSTFSEYGDNTVDDDQFEVYYGTYVDGVFTVLSMRDSEYYYLSSDYWVEPELTAEEKLSFKTLIIYDNDNRYLVYSEENNKPLAFSSTNDFNTTPETVLSFDGNSYSITYDTAVDSNGFVDTNNLYYSYDTVAYTKVPTSTKYTCGYYDECNDYYWTELDVDGSNMVVDGFVLDGLYYETGWTVVNDGENRYLEYNDQYSPLVGTYNPPSDDYHFVLNNNDTTNTWPKMFVFDDAYHNVYLTDSSFLQSLNIVKYGGEKVIKVPENTILSELESSYADPTINAYKFVSSGNVVNSIYLSFGAGYNTVTGEPLQLGDRIDVYKNKVLVASMTLNINTLNYNELSSTSQNYWSAFGLDHDLLFDINEVKTLVIPS